VGATKQQTQAAFRIVVAVTEAIREAGTPPEGELYAVLMAQGIVSLEAFERIVQRAVGSGLVEKRNHQLRWGGPEITREVLA
jgi:hypothetical protein